MLDKIIFFLCVMQYRSLSKAAKQYGIAFSTASRWISELEETLDVTLLKRSTRQIIPTTIGQWLFENFSPISEEINRVLTGIQHASHVNKGVIRIASTPLFATRYLGRLIGEFLQIHPQVTFKIIQNPFPVDLLRDVDFSIRAIATYQGYKEKDSLLVKRSLFKEPLIVCCSPSYLKNHKLPSSPQDLQMHNCLYAASLVGGNQWFFNDSDRQVAVKIAQTVEVDDSRVLKSIALAGGGIACLPISLIRSELALGQLVSILNDYVNSSFEYCLYFHPDKQMPPRCINFKNYLINKVDDIARMISQDG